MLKTRYSCKIVFKLQIFQKTLFRNNVQISNFMKIRTVGGELFHVDGQTQKDTRTGGWTWT